MFGTSLDCRSREGTKDWSANLRVHKDHDGRWYDKYTGPRTVAGRVVKDHWQRRRPKCHILRYGVGRIKYIVKDFATQLQDFLRTGQLRQCFHVFRVRSSAIEHTLKDFLGYSADKIQSFFEYNPCEDDKVVSEAGRSRAVVDKGKVQDLVDSLHALKLPVEGPPPVVIDLTVSGTAAGSSRVGNKRQAVIDLTGSDSAPEEQDTRTKRPRRAPSAQEGVAEPRPNPFTHKPSTEVPAERDEFVRRKYLGSLQLVSGNRRSACIAEKNPFGSEPIQVEKENQQVIDLTNDGLATPEGLPQPSIKFSPPSAATFSAPPVAPLDIASRLNPHIHNVTQQELIDAGGEEFDDAATLINDDVVFVRQQPIPKSKVFDTSFDIHETETFVRAAGFIAGSQKKWIKVGTSRAYPHVFSNHEKLPLPGPPPFYIFPLLPYPQVYDGSCLPGLDRVVLDGKYAHAGIIRHGPAPPGQRCGPFQVLKLP